MEELNELEKGYDNRFFEQPQYDALIKVLQSCYGERMSDIAECFVNVEHQGITYKATTVRCITFDELSTFINPHVEFQIPSYEPDLLQFMEYILELVDLWIRHQKAMAEFFEQEVFDESMYYQNNLNKELLELYIKCKRDIPTRRHKHNEVSLSINKGFRKDHKRIRIPNFDNWLFRSAIPQYIEKCYPAIKSVEDAEIVLSHLRRAGRPNDVELLNEVIYGTYRLIHDFENSKVKVSLNECKIISCYVRFIGLVDKDNEVIDDLNIAARIREIEKHNKQEKMALNKAQRLNINTLSLIRRFELSQSFFNDLK